MENLQRNCAMQSSLMQRVLSALHIGFCSETSQAGGLATHLVSSFVLVWNCQHAWRQRSCLQQGADAGLSYLGEWVVLVGKAKECACQGTAELGFLKQRWKKNWFFSLFLILINRKGCSGWEGLGFFPSSRIPVNKKKKKKFKRWEQAEMIYWHFIHSLCFEVKFMTNHKSKLFLEISKGICW